MEVQGYTLIDENVTARPTGYDGRDYDKYPVASLKCAKRYDVSANVDPAKYQYLIELKNTNRSWITDLCDAKGVIPKNQQDSNFCWGHAAVHCMEIAYAQQGGPIPPLSAFYACALIKGGRNQGGSGIEAVQWLSENGTCTEALHPSMDFSTRNAADVVADAAKHKILEYDELDPNDHASIISCVLNDIPVTVGVPRWSHEVTIVKLLWDPTATWNHGVLYVIDNSWGTSWGTKGRGTLSRSYSIFDEAGAVRSVSPYALAV